MKKYSELFNNETIQGLPGYTSDDVIQVLKPYLEDLESSGEFKVIAVTVIGSRSRGSARKDSDLDVLVEYTGTMREDDAFNALHYEPIYIEGIPVDINPIRKEESGTTAEWLERSKRYLGELK